MTMFGSCNLLEASSNVQFVAASAGLRKGGAKLHCKVGLLALGQGGQQTSQGTSGSASTQDPPPPAGQLSDLVIEKAVSERAFVGIWRMRPLDLL